MGLLKKRTPWEQAFREVWQQEQDFLRKYEMESESLLNRTLTHAVPEKLMGTLQGAFVKAFGLVFEKGSHGIAKVGNQENRCQIFQVNQYAVDLQENRKNLRAFSRAANRSGMGNALLCGGTGIGTVQKRPSPLSLLLLVGNNVKRLWNRAANPRSLSIRRNGNTVKYSPNRAFRPLSGSLGQ